VKDTRSFNTEARDYRTRERLNELGFEHVQYREGTSDERVIEEVLFRRAYRRITVGFDVEQGERWLDLGANIGAFALYCKWHSATAVCFEPDPGCFKLLLNNVQPFLGFTAVQAAVTHLEYETIPFWGARDENDHHRYTAFPKKTSPRHPAGELPNWWAGDRMLQQNYRFDGIKMDIEGSEHGILDNDLLPKCNKLAMEYHIWLDKSMANLRRRLNYLKDRFKHVKYPPEFDRMMDSGEEFCTSYYDRTIFCWNDK
jgi:FkbM family methyltransferase